MNQHRHSSLPQPFRVLQQIRLRSKYGMLLMAVCFVSSSQASVKGTTSLPFRITQEERRSLGIEGTAALKATVIAEKALASGNAEMLYLAAKAYAVSPIEDPDSSKAKDFCRKAAEAGNPEAKVRMVWFDVQNDQSAESKLAAISKIDELRKSGNKTADFAFNQMLMLGFRGDSKVPEGFDKISRLADNGDPDAQFMIGEVLFEGIVTSRDPKKAVEYFKKAAEKNHPTALLNLGICYAHGIGVERSVNEAFRLWLLSAELGDRDAMHNIGNAYLHGNGVALNTDASMHWFQLSSDAGNAESMAAYSMQVLASKSASIEERKNALGLLIKASDLGNRAANFVRGKALVSGAGGAIRKNIPEGFSYLLKAAQAGVPPAQLEVASLLRLGHNEGIQSDKVEALKWAILAERGQLPEAASIVAKLKSTSTADEISQAITRADNFIPTDIDVTMSGKMRFIPRQPE